MQIHGLQQAHAANPVDSSPRSKPAGPVESTPTVQSVSSDQLDLSAEAQAISQSQAATGGSASRIRAEKVAAIRQAIAEGTYESSERLSAALDKVLDAFA